MKILVTGAQGFVGRYFAAHALALDTSSVIMGIGRSQRDDLCFTHGIRSGDVTIAAPLPAQMRTEFGGERYRYHSVDLRDEPAMIELLREFEPDAVVHMASGLRDDAATHLFGTNVLGAMALVEAVARAAPRVKVVVLGSTGGIYGAVVEESLPIRESEPCAPVDLYSASKLSSEHVTRIVAARTGVPVVWARLFNLVGPGQDERHVCGRFASQAAAIARGRSPAVIEAGNLEATRDFIDVRDVARGISALIDGGSPGTAYNVASGVETSISDVLSATLRAAKVERITRVVRLPPRAEDIARHYADVSKMAALGFSARHSLEGSVADVVAYYLDEAAAAAG